MSTQRPTISTSHAVTVALNITIDPEFAALIRDVGGATAAETLARIEGRMIDFDKKLDKLEEKLNAFDAREAKEDEDSILTKAENTKLKNDLAALQAEMAANGSTPEREARFQALLDRIDASNKIDSEVLPEPAPETPAPAPEPAPTPEPTPAPPTEDDLEVEEQPEPTPPAA